MSHHTPSTGEILNPHIPKYIVEQPWYTNKSKPGDSTTLTNDQLSHQRAGTIKKKNNINKWYKRGDKTIVNQATKYRKGACKNCGAMDHKERDCMERPRKRGAVFTNKNIAPDRKIENLEFDYASKRDHWASYDLDDYQDVVKRYQVLEKERKRIVKDNKKNLEEKKSQEEEEEIEKDDQENQNKVDDEDIRKEDEEFSKLQIFQSEAHDGKTRTNSRNLRIREQTAKYLLNLNVDSPFYDPKTRSMRGNPNPEDAKAFYQGDNAIRFTGDYDEFQKANYFSWEAQKRGQNIQITSNPSKAELTHKQYLQKKRDILKDNQNSILRKYGCEIPDEKKVKLFESEFVVPQAIKKNFVKSRYEEDLLINGHSEIFGSYWENGVWGYKCCKKLDKNSFCNGVLNKRALVFSPSNERSDVKKRKLTN